MIDNLAVTCAQYYAIGAHGNQKRKYTGDPYWFHPNSVVSILKYYTETTTEMLQAAWLHDVVEDTDVSIFDIQFFFGAKVANYVSDLTEPSKDCGNRAARKAAYNAQLATAPPEVQTIKYADLIDNTSTIVEHDPEFAKLYLEEKQILLNVMDRGCPILYDLACRKVGL